MSDFKTIEWLDGRIVFLDQTELPHHEVYLETEDYEQITSAIKTLKIRGAPAIGVAAAMGIALAAQKSQQEDTTKFLSELDKICDEFAATRPTAVNLFWAIERMKRRAGENASKGVVKIGEALKEEALSIAREDEEINRRMGSIGAKLIEDGDSVLTHCNAGALATFNFGTALGVVRAAHEEGKRIHVYVDETRPLLQGARLTAWELMREKIPMTLITDNMAGFFMARGKIDKVFVGADRIAANGDTANKIGTYSIAVLAKENRLPFYVVAPTSTIDLSLGSGEEIPIEERSEEEVTSVLGLRVAPSDVRAANPSFDVTPSRYITAIVTENGLARAPFEAHLEELCKKDSSTGK
jgi:methylthioribose-1-phosphate isomerase